MNKHSFEKIPCGKKNGWNPNNGISNLMDIEIIEPINFIFEYRNNLDEYLPLIDHQTKVFPERSEFGEVNIGWNAGCVGKRPWFLECWAEGYTMITVFITSKGIEEYSYEQIDKWCEENGIYEKYDTFEPKHITFNKLKDENKNEFFVLNLVIGLEDEPAIANATIYSFKSLNHLNDCSTSSPCDFTDIEDPDGSIEPI
jgi:hypothetical protein